MALINCPECEREISDKAISCPHCGFPMEQTTQHVVEPTVEACKYCGEENPINSDYCDSCGMRLTEYDLVRYDSANEEVATTTETYQNQSLNIQKEQLQINSEILELERIKQANQVHCPRCGSTSLSGNKKGYGIGKGVVGAAILGPIGLIAGNINSKKVIVTCLNCRHRFKA